MDNAFILLCMLFFHIFDDFKMQGILATYKQKKFWLESEEVLKYKNHEIYRNDWIISLVLHSFSWAFLTMLPVAYVCNFKISVLFLIFFVANIAIHFFVDHLKANSLKINLIQDQIIHILQIVVTFLVLVK